MESPDQVSTVRIPPEYADLALTFCKKKATQLPPHRRGVCAIDLLVDAAYPKSHVYPLSQAETEAMETYVSESLHQGFIQPSISPVSLSFFFVKKKDDGLRLCIDYRGLNKITVKYSYPLPLINTIIELMHGACFFSQNWISGVRTIWCVFGRETSVRRHLVPPQGIMSTSSCRMG